MQKIKRLIYWIYIFYFIQKDMKKRLLWLVAIPLIAIGSLTYANDFIVHDTDNWTITVYSADKSYGITIADKNLWAENVGDYGYYYQWWNNHWNYAWTNTWTLNELLDADVSERVNKWYSGDNDKFIIFNNWNKNTYDYRSGVYYTNATDNSYVWDSAYNNLRCGWNDNDDSDATIVKWYDTGNHVVTNPENRQWPCPDGYHVPSAWEWWMLIKYWAETNNISYRWNSWDYSLNTWFSDFVDNFKLPFGGTRFYYSVVIGDQVTKWSYWSSTLNGSMVYRLLTYKNHYRYPDDVELTGDSYRVASFNMRCFKIHHLVA